MRSHNAGTAICVAGMHRSGTSMIARLLNLAGVYLGEEWELPPPGPDNPEGFWENAHFRKVNDRILAQLAAGWDLVPVFPPGWVLRSDMESLRQQAADLVQRLGSHGMWGWKDPRNSLTLPFWRNAAGDLKIVICLRSPLEVAQSLQKRGFSSIAFGLDLWLQYNRHLLSAIPDCGWVITHYDAYFHDPTAELQRLSDELGLGLAAETIGGASSAVSPQARHNRAVPGDIHAGEIPPKVSTCYADMCAEAGPVYREALRSGISIALAPAHSTRARPPRVLRAAGSQKPTAAMVQALSEQVGAKEQTIQALAAELAILAGKVRSLEALAAQAEAHERLANVLKVQLEGKEQEIQTLSSLTAEKERTLQALSSLTAESERTLQTLSAALEGKSERVEALSTQLIEQNRNLELLSARVEDRQRAVAQLTESLRVKEQQLSAQGERLKERSRVVAARDDGIAWLRGELALAQGELEGIKVSRWWRLGIAAAVLWAGVARVTSALRHPMRWLRGNQAYWRARAGARRFLSRTLPRPIKRFGKKWILREPILAPLASIDPAQAATLPAQATPAEDPCPALTLLPGPAPQELAAVLNWAPPSAPRHRSDVICFSIIDWAFRRQRPQQLMAQFAAHGHRVYYVNLSNFLPPGNTPRAVVREVAPNVFDVSLAVARPLDVYGEVIEGANQEAVVASLDELRRSQHIDEAIGYVMIASWGPVALEVRKRWGWRIVYDCMDEWESFPGIERPVLDMEQRLVQACDLLVVTAQRLYEKWRPYKRPTVLARNAADYTFYAAHCAPNNILEGVRHPVVGYYGAIADWFDVDLLANAARQRPGYTFVLLGGVFNVDISELQVLPNVRLLGQQPYETMPLYLYHFDACMIPFKINSITEATDPVKLYEYLSGGKPVVSVALRELEPYGKLLYIARDGDDFLAKLDAALAENDRNLVARRKALARRNSWGKRYEQIVAGLAERVPRASIVVVTHGNPALTKLCLESIIRNTEYPNYEITVVDNNSGDGTEAYLRYMASNHPSINVILNPHNDGFARANNQGLARATGDYLVLLNNDTIVPPGWLSRLLRHLGDPAIGLVGPVTNFVGNEAKVPVSYRTWAEMEAFARDYTWAHDDEAADIQVLAMFCVAMRRDTYEAVGPLDEQFGIGMFEDDDYAERVRARGLRVTCALDVFVHHFGQAAFRQLIANGQYDALFEDNRQRYEAKWNVLWEPHQNLPLSPAQLLGPAVDG